MPKKKKLEEKTRAQPQVTLIEDPFGIKTTEIAEAQNNPDELPFDEEFETISEEADATDLDSADLDSADLDSVELDSADLDSPALEEQLERLATAISAENKKFEEAVQELVDEDPTIRLAAEIAEDQALQAEDRRLQEQEEKEVRDLEALGEAQLENDAREAAPLDLTELQSCIEAILFISDKPLSIQRLQTLLGPLAEIDLFSEALTELTRRYQAVHHGFELVEVAGGYQFRTKPSRADLARKLVKTQTQRLSAGSMETLAIVAYKQPVMKEEIDKIRGVDSSYFIRQLIDRKLIEMSGRSELPGRPLLYSTTSEFLEVFGLKDFSSMPSLRELEQMIPTSQSENPEDEDPKVKEMRRLVSEMKSDRTSALYYNPKEDEVLLKEIREKVSSIPTSTPYLDEMKAAEEQAKKLAALEAAAAAAPPLLET